MDFTETWRKIALFCGFILDPSIELHTVFALNVVIYYFSVESYRLCQLLIEKKISKKNKLESENDDALSGY